MSIDRGMNKDVCGYTMEYLTIKKGWNNTICSHTDRPRNYTKWSKPEREIQIAERCWKWREVTLCPTLCDPLDCSLLGSSIHGIFQARVLEWVAISFSRGSSQPRDYSLQMLYHLSHQGSPPKGNQPWMFIERTDAEAEAPVLWPPDSKNWLLKKDPDSGKDWRQKEKRAAEDEMVG